MSPQTSMRRRVRLMTLALRTLAALAACTDPAHVVSPLTEEQQPSGLFIQEAINLRTSLGC